MDSIDALLPASFPAGTRFADVEGVPCSKDGHNCRAWDVPDGRWFNGASFSHNGTLFSEAEFRALVARVNPTGMQLPKEFPPKTQFKEIDGKPVSCTWDMHCWVWGVGDPKRFSPLTFARSSAKVLTEAQFRELIERVRAFA